MEDKKHRSTTFEIQKESKHYIGTQITLDLYGCSNKILTDLTYLKKVLLEISKYSGFTILSSKYVTDTENVLGVLFIKGKQTSGSVNLTTYPEYSFASIDICFASGSEDTDNIILLLKKGFESKQSKIAYLYRGNFLPKVVDNVKKVAVAK